ncbi:MAG: MBL fold metallo-hydrolase [Bacilli bacterium]|nr:MBL fold metallo-hydrolase [Bacilli bacterium]
MKFYIFASGSKGNATLIVDKNVRILIDLGISRKQLEDHLKSIHSSIDEIDFILLTHEHIDHIKGIESIHHTPIYGGKNTYACANYRVIEPYVPFKFRHLTILPIELSHDAYTPLGFIFKNDKEKLVYITDTGYLSEKNMKLAWNANYYILESNHNRKMLLKTHRPVYVKERIMSEFGHMSNEDASLYLSEMIGDQTSQVYLAHISQEANTYELAETTCKKCLMKKKINLDNLVIKTAKQFEMCVGGDCEN